MLEVVDLKKYFRIRHSPLARLRGHRDHIVRAVDGVTLSIADQEVLGLVGESGCGKTTLARTILRLLPPTGGEVLFRGRSVFGMRQEELRGLRREMQVIFQDSISALDPRMDAWRVLEEPLLLHRGGNKAERDRRIASIMDRVKLSPAFLRRHPAELSGGQRQRLSMARALLVEPRLLIADEPLAGLDPVVSLQLLDLMLSLRREMGLTYLFISHDLGTISYASDRVAVMYRGRIVEIISGDRFESGARHPYTRLLQSAQRPSAESEIGGDVHLHHPEDGTGCAFRPRCPDRASPCLDASPALCEVAPGHWVACHLDGWRRR